MSRVTQREFLLVALLIGLGAGLRLVFRDIPNFAPIAAISLFAGYRLRRTAFAAVVPLAAMALSDISLGAYSWPMMAVVYGAFVAPALVGPLLRRHLPLHGPARSAAAPVVTLISCSLAASLLFFATTNFAAWMWFDSYPKTWPGLASCYVAALPFFRYTLCSDFIFAVVLFGSHAIAVQRVERRSPVIL